MLESPALKIFNTLHIIRTHKISTAILKKFIWLAKSHLKSYAQETQKQIPTMKILSLYGLHHNKLMMWKLILSNVLVLVLYHKKIRWYCYTYVCTKISDLSCISVFTDNQIDGLVLDCSNSIATALELLQSCTKPLKWYTVIRHVMIN